MYLLINSDDKPNANRCFCIILILVCHPVHYIHYTCTETHREIEIDQLKIDLINLWVKALLLPFYSFQTAHIGLHPLTNSLIRLTNSKPNMEIFHLNCHEKYWMASNWQAISEGKKLREDSASPSQEKCMPYCNLYCIYSASWRY